MQETTGRDIAAMRPSWVGHSLLVLGLVAIGVFAYRWLHQDAAFCQRALAGLAEGRGSVARSIDWAHLSALDMDVGSTYQALADDRERAQYRQAFIAAFAKAFQESGARAEAFARWRVVGRQGLSSVVAVDHPVQPVTLVFHVSGVVQRKIQGIRWR